jgi:hypothetical protein
MEPWTTTLNAIREHSPCASGWAELLKSLGKTKADDEPLLVSTILESNGLDDTLWVLRAVTNHDREIRLFAVWCARQVQHLMTDRRSIDALDVAEQFAKGEATEEQLSDARSAAESAAKSAWDAWDAWAAESAAEFTTWADLHGTRASEFAARASVFAADSADWFAAQSAASAAASAARAARSATWDAAWSAADSAQKEELLRIISGGEY